MSSIMQDVLDGGVVVRDQAGNPVTPIGVTVSNVYRPPNTFTMDVAETAAPNSCGFKITPAQMNAIVSELLALAVAMTPNGNWSNGSVTNLGAAFSSWLQSHLTAGDPHPQYTTVAEAQALVDALRTQLLGGSVSAALDTFFEVANRITTDETLITSLTTSLAGKQPLDQDLTDIAALARAKGALIVGGAAAWSLLGASTDGYVLTLDAAQPAGVKWAAAGGYTLPVATGTALGGVKVGTNLAVDGAGVVSLSIPNVTFNSGGIIGQIAAAAATDIPLIVKGAAGQTASLQEWRNSGGAVVASMANNGLFGTGYLLVGGNGASYGDGVASVAVSYYRSGLSMGSGGLVSWGPSGPSGADTALKRNAAGVVEINDGTAGNYRDLKLRNLIFADGSSQSAASGARVTSSQLSITASTTLTFAHGLGAAPTRWGAYAVCLTTSGGFTAGDKITLSTDHGYTWTSGLYANATSVKYDVPAALYTGGSATNLADNANFAIVLWAEK